MARFLALTLTHSACLAVGFVLGVYMLPILTAPDSPSPEQVESAASTSRYTGDFRRNLQDSDALHWGEGRIFVGDRSISLMGRIAPGPDYRLYLAPRFVETESDFLALKNRALEVGTVKTFENFIVPVPDSVDVSAFNTVVIWCESFSQFITAAEYR
ncbi:MAG: DM13 domain-containing protein [Gammaproteobacteria bacterium]|nr:MAG: hypothetical protein AMJ59_21870 [Gammaproteobacteria bacterium SG8_31]